MPRPAAFVFDAYGTLFDFAGAISRRRDTLRDRADTLMNRWREKQLQYAWLRSLQDRYADFEQVTADALDYALDSLGIHDSRLRDELLDLSFTPPLYPDALRALIRLRAAETRVLILSNGTASMLERAIAASAIAPFVNGVLSVDAVQTYKPSPRAYDLATGALGVPADHIVFVSSNGWDAYAAAATGFRVLWCNRQGQPPERLPACTGVAAQVAGRFAASPAFPIAKWRAPRSQQRATRCRDEGALPQPTIDVVDGATACDRLARPEDSWMGRARAGPAHH
jgi:2-haloacid dehalogenase